MNAKLKLVKECCIIYNTKNKNIQNYIHVLMNKNIFLKCVQIIQYMSFGSLTQ